jgi:hypothetical protein
MQVTTRSIGCSHLAMSVHSFHDSSVLRLTLSISVTVAPYCGPCTHSSASSFDLLMFSVSQMDTEGKLVDQSRYVVATTILNGLLWKASYAERTSRTEPYRDSKQHTAQNSLQEFTGDIVILRSIYCDIYTNHFKMIF